MSLWIEMNECYSNDVRWILNDSCLSLLFVTFIKVLMNELVVGCYHSEVWAQLDYFLLEEINTLLYNRLIILIKHT